LVRLVGFPQPEILLYAPSRLCARAGHARAALENARETVCGAEALGGLREPATTARKVTYGIGRGWVSDPVGDLVM